MYVSDRVCIVNIVCSAAKGVFVVDIVCRSVFQRESSLLISIAPDIVSVVEIVCSASESVSVVNVVCSASEGVSILNIACSAL